MRLFILSRAGAQHTRQRSGCSESPLRKRPSQPGPAEREARVRRSGLANRTAGGRSGSGSDEWLLSIGSWLSAGFIRSRSEGVRGLANSRLSKKYISRRVQKFGKTVVRNFFFGGGGFGGGCTKTKHNQRKFRQQMPKTLVGVRRLSNQK